MSRIDWHTVRTEVMLDIIFIDIFIRSTRIPLVISVSLLWIIIKSIKSLGGRVYKVCIGCVPVRLGVVIFSLVFLSLSNEAQEFVGSCTIAGH